MNAIRTLFRVETIKFFIAGISATVVDLGLLAVQIYLLHFNPILSFTLGTIPINISVANAISTLVAIGVSFALQRVWAFKATGEKVVKQLGKYLAVVALTYCYTNLLYGFLNVNLALDALIAKVTVLAVQMCTSYLLYKFFVFGKVERRQFRIAALLRVFIEWCFQARVALPLFGLVFVCLFITNGVPFVYSDGYYYYHTARTLVDEGTFASATKPEFYDYRGHAFMYYNGKYGEVTSPGGALFLVPGLTVAKLFRSPEQSIYTDYYMAYNGHTLADGLAILVTASIFTFLALTLVYRSLRLIGCGERTSVFTTIITYASSYAIWYALLSPAFTHTYELFCAALVVWALLKFRQKRKDRYLLSLAFGLGMLFLLRPIFAVLAVFIGIYLLKKRDWKTIAKLVALGIPFLAIWLLYNYISYGTWIASGYALGAGQTFGTEFNGFNLLFSLQRGWLIYSPLFLFSVIGWGLWWRKVKWFAGFCLLSIVSIIVIYGFWPAWWGGDSYGQRFLIVLVPLCAPGIAYLLERAKKKVVMVGALKISLRRILITAFLACTTWSVFLTCLYRFTPVTTLRPASDSVGNMPASDRYTPLDMIGYHITLIRSATSIKGYIASVYSSAHGGTSIAALLVGSGDVVLRLDERTAGELKLKLFKPPVFTQELPEAISFYLVNEDNEVYAGRIALIDTEEEFTLYCTDSCEADERVQLNLTTAYPAQLSRQEYVAIKPEKFPFTLYFQHPTNIQVKGPVGPVSSEASYFTLPGNTSETM